VRSRKRGIGGKSGELLRESQGFKEVVNRKVAKEKGLVTTKRRRKNQKAMGGKETGRNWGGGYKPGYKDRNVSILGKKPEKGEAKRPIEKGGLRPAKGKFKGQC